VIQSIEYKEVYIWKHIPIMSADIKKGYGMVNGLDHPS
jgi:hypothetical protein